MNNPGYAVTGSHGRVKNEFMEQHLEKYGNI